MKNSDFYLAVKYFFVWRILIIFITLLGINFIQSGSHFLGGTNELYTSDPLFWSASNFDGTHYMRIARYGYEPLTHFFFPLYPLLTYLVNKIISGNTSLFTLQISSHIISNFSTFFSIWGLYKLLKLDLKKRAAKWGVISFLIFPTSSYLVASYTESLFIALVVWSYYFFRTEKYLIAGLLGGFSSATRIMGVNLLISYLSETVFKKINLKKIIALLIVPSGLLIYMIYLYNTTGSPLTFNKYGENFGEYRSSHMILLPQVFYRYIFKILPNLNYHYFQGTFPPVLELSSAVFLTIASIWSIFKLRSGYTIFLILGFVMPTLYNSFVSLPRYALVFFPIYLLLGQWLYSSNWIKKMTYLIISFTLMTIVTIMFTRGLWIS